MTLVRLLRTARTAALAAWERRDPDRRDFDPAHLADTVAWLTSHPARDPTHRAADALDILTINRYRRAHLDVQDRGAIDQARAAGVTWPTLADRLCYRSYQAAEAYHLRLVNQATATDSARSEVAARRTRKPQTPTDPVIQLARDLVACAAHLPADLGEVCGLDLDDVTYLLPDTPTGTASNGLTAALRVICAALATRTDLNTELAAVVSHSGQILPSRTG